MRLFKRLYTFILQSFLPLFAMTFFIVLFIVLMQFLWKYIDTLVGKGLSFGVLAELFFYAALTMVPMALPLAILLASLMTFGNLGEKSELTAMKAAGISLVNVMKPLIVFVSILAVAAFFFQNDVLPRAQVKMYTLLFSVKQKSPELEITEGSFYSQIPGYNFYVRKKDHDTGLLRDVMIYDVGSSSNAGMVLLADSARLSFTPDKKYLYLHLFHGRQFENLGDIRALQNKPFGRESFHEKEIFIPFDANFNRLDEEGIRKQYVGKNISELSSTIDSLGHNIDSLGYVAARELNERAFPRLMLTGTSSANSSASYTPSEFNREETHDAFSRPTAAVTAANPVARNLKGVTPVSIDSLISTLTESNQAELMASARRIAEMKKNEFEFRSAYISDEKRILRRHEIELIKKFTLSVACIIFFFIGAPLGAIIRKGGLGTPLVISVLLFLVYYIIDNTGYKMARDGHWPIWLGMWLSTFVLAPLGIYVTYKAMNDSTVFDKESYMRIIRYVFGLADKRHIPLKKVIINEVDPAVAKEMAERALDAVEKWHRGTPVVLHYMRYWNQGIRPGGLARLGDRLNALAKYLSDSRDIKLLAAIEAVPVIRPLGIYYPVRNRRLRSFCKWCFPVGLLFYGLSLPYQRRLLRELHSAERNLRLVIDRIETM